MSHLRSCTLTQAYVRNHDGPRRRNIHPGRARTDRDSADVRSYPTPNCSNPTYRPPARSPTTWRGGRRPEGGESLGHHRVFHPDAMATAATGAQGVASRSAATMSHISSAADAMVSAATGAASRSAATPSATSTWQARRGRAHGGAPTRYSQPKLAIQPSGRRRMGCWTGRRYFTLSPRRARGLPRAPSCQARCSRHGRP